MRLEDLFILGTQVLVQHDCLGLEQKDRESLTIEEERMMKKGRNEDIFLRFRILFAFVPCYKSKLFETRQKYHKV